jgi:hypothetical protein
MLFTSISLEGTSHNPCLHSAKTFWGWQERQLPDGTLILTAPSGQTYVTTPGSALLFPRLCTPTGEVHSPTPRAAKTAPTASRPNAARIDWPVSARKAFGDRLFRTD